MVVVVVVVGRWMRMSELKWCFSRIGGDRWFDRRGPFLEGNGHGNVVDYYYCIEMMMMTDEERDFGI